MFEVFGLHGGIKKIVLQNVMLCSLVGGCNISEGERPRPYSGQKCFQIIGTDLTDYMVFWRAPLSRPPT
jgi:hypothetical protein